MADNCSTICVVAHKAAAGRKFLRGERSEAAWPDSPCRADISTQTNSSIAQLKSF
jgi:hypothetical protein